MTERLDHELARELEALARQGLERHLVHLDGPRERELTSNDYLGFSTHPAILDGAREAVARYGAGARASRLLGGGSPLDREAEERAAEWLTAEAALLFPTGYQANLGLITTLASRDTQLFSDALNHASLIDAARLCRARVSIYRHGDPEHLEALLAAAPAAPRRLVVTESVFSMDGDLAPLAELHEVCLRHGAELIVDEAHAAGLLGPRGAGGWAASGLPVDGSGALVARVVTGGKALGVAGAFVAGSARLRDLLVHRARSFIFTTGAPPAVAGAIHAALAAVRDAEEERRRALDAARRLAVALDLPEPSAAIVPFVVGASDGAMAAAATLRTAGFEVHAVRPPTVPEGTARIRFACHAYNPPEVIDELVAALRDPWSSPATTTDNVAAELVSAEHAATRQSRRAPTSSLSSHATGPPSTRAAAETSSAATNSGGGEDRASVGIDRSSRPLVIVGTDTGVGKTVASALLARAAAATGDVLYWKPVQTGKDDDTATVHRLTEGSAVRRAEPAYRFALPASPHEAAAAEGAEVDLRHLDRELARLSDETGDGHVLVELAGGLLVPYTMHSTQADWLAGWSRVPEIVLVARSGLGTLNHTELTLEALRRRGLTPRAVLLVGERHPANERTLRERGGLPVVPVPWFEPLSAKSVGAWVGGQTLNDLLLRHDPTAGTEAGRFRREGTTARDPNRLTPRDPDRTTPQNPNRTIAQDRNRLTPQDLKRPASVPAEAGPLRGKKP